MAIFNTEGNPVPLDEFIAGGRRWWSDFARPGSVRAPNGSLAATDPTSRGSIARHSGTLARRRISIRVPSSGPRTLAQVRVAGRYASAATE
jgi:hypothetical protein